MYTISSLILGLLACCSSCTSNRMIQDTTKKEVIDFHFRHYAHKDTFLCNPFWPTKERVWRKDSIVIEEVRYIKIDEDGYGKSTVTDPVRLYRYTDLRTAMRYEYKSFSDTATLIRKFKQSDSSKVSGGWGFFQDKDRVRNGTVTWLADTMIGGQQYRHAHIKWGAKENIIYHLDAWYWPEKRATLFSLDSRTYSETGNPMVGFHIYPEGNTGLKAILEVTYISDRLTGEEEKVFTAWEKYAREHPAK